MSYKLRDDHIIWDAMSPQDVIIADLLTGCYSTLSGEGAEYLWSLLINHLSEEQIHVQCRQQFNHFTKESEEQIQLILTNLCMSGILVPHSEGASSYQASQTKPLNNFAVVLTKYDDMQTLLQLDPIDTMLED